LLEEWKYNLNALVTNVSKGEVINIDPGQQSDGKKSID
jgi:hypothetical protein